MNQFRPTVRPRRKMKGLRLSRQEFSAPTKRKVAERANYICSNPDCTKLTVGPDIASQNKSTNTGVAAHMASAAPGGPRYDISMTAAARSGIRNAIWLCGSCSLLIDKNDGADYPVDVLRRWKQEHERLIKSHIESSTSVRLLPLGGEKDQAKTLIDYLDQRSALFVPMDQEHFPHVADSVRDIRTYLTAMQGTLHPHEALAAVVDQINDACRAYMSSTSRPASDREIEIALSVLRKSVILSVNDLVNRYSLVAPKHLR